MARLLEQIEGRPLFIGALQDVTDSKVAEEALARACQLTTSIFCDSFRYSVARSTCRTCHVQRFSEFGTCDFLEIRSRRPLRSNPMQAFLRGSRRCDPVISSVSSSFVAALALSLALTFRV